MADQAHRPKGPANSGIVWRYLRYEEHVGDERDRTVEQRKKGTARSVRRSGVS